MKKVYLSLGSNVGDREGNLQQALRLLQASDFRILRISSVYETAPVDVTNQPWFLNLVIEAETSLFPMQLLKRIGKIESEMGRKRLVAKGPRTIDIDILIFGRFLIDCATLVVPHPRLPERRFVLEPLAELAPDLRHPILRRTMRELLGATGAQAIRKIPFVPEMPENERSGLDHHDNAQ